MAAAVRRYQLRLYISIKHLTVNVMDRNNGTLVTSASTVDHALKRAFDIGRTVSPKTGAILGEVLARRLMVEGLHHGQGLERGIYANLRREIEKKGVEDKMGNSKIVWAVVNALKDNGINVSIDDSDNNDFKL